MSAFEHRLPPLLPAPFRYRDEHGIVHHSAVIKFAHRDVLTVLCTEVLVPKWWVMPADVPAVITCLECLGAHEQ